MYEYEGICTQVIDGDTIEVCVDLGFQIKHTIRVRLLNVTAAELFSGTPDNRLRGQKAKEYLSQLVLGKSVFLKTEKDRITFNRYLGTIFVDSKNINEICQTHYVNENLT